MECFAFITAITVTLMMSQIIVNSNVFLTADLD